MRLLRGGRVVARDHVLQGRGLLLGGPHLEPLALDDASVLGVQNLPVDLLLAKVGALVGLELLEECGGEVDLVVVGAGVHHVHLAADLALVQVDDQLLRLGGGGHDLLDPWYGRVLQTHRELHLVVRVVDVLERAQLVEPTAVELLAPVPLRLGSWYALYDRAVDQGDLQHLLVVVLDQRLRYDVQQARVPLEARRADVVRGRRGHQPPGVGVLPRPNPNPVARGVRFSRSTARQHQKCVVVAVLGLSLVRERLNLPPNLPQSGVKLVLGPVLVVLCEVCEYFLLFRCQHTAKNPSSTKKGRSVST